MDFGITWQFRNGHTYSRFFDTPSERDSFMHETGLISHPDITLLTLLYPHSTIKDVQLKNTQLNERLINTSCMDYSQDIPAFTASS